MAGIRQRLALGEEDTLTNLPALWRDLYGRNIKIDREYLAKYGSSSLVNSFAENRGHDLVKALASPTANEGMVEMRAFSCPARLLVHDGGTTGRG